MAGLKQLNWASEGVGATAAALVDLSTVAGNKISNPPWVKFQSAGWVNFPSAPTGKDVWLLDGRPVDNALRKANQNSRVLAGRIRNRAGIGLYAPWCQGVVLVTGDKGHSISLIKDEPSLQVWTPDGITKALTSAEGLTATKAYELIDAQRELVLATLGQLRQQIAENNRFQQYQKTQCLLDQNGLELWMAEYRLENWSSGNPPIFSTHQK